MKIAVAVSAKVRTMIDHIREDFTAFVDGFTALTSARATLSPKFMKAFGAWQAETGGNFVSFVRLLDPEVPEDRDGYRAHKSYQAADYLRRLQAGATRETSEIPESERPVTAYRALAYFVATVLPTLDPSGALWTAFVEQMHWTEQQAARLQTTANKLGAVKLPAKVNALLSKAS